MATTPKMLRMTFEFHVPTDTSRNIYGKHVERAAEQITAAVRTLAPEAFPWANELRVRTEWSYLYQDTPGTHSLPPNELNTPKESRSAEQEEA